MYSLIRSVTIRMTKAGAKCVNSAVQQILWPNPRGEGGGGYSDIFIHTLARFFFFGGGGQNFEVQYFWGVFRKN